MSTGSSSFFCGISIFFLTNCSAFFVCAIDHGFCPYTNTCCHHFIITCN
jgi:hypothetical protein